MAPHLRRRLYDPLIICMYVGHIEIMNLEYENLLKQTMQFKPYGCIEGKQNFKFDYPLARFSINGFIPR